MSQIYNEIFKQLKTKITWFHPVLDEELTFLQYQLSTELTRKQCIKKLYNSLLAIEQRLAYAKNQMAQEVYFKRRLFSAIHQAEESYLEWQRAVQERAWEHYNFGQNDEKQQQVALYVNRKRQLEQQEAKKLCEQLKTLKIIIKKQLAKQLDIDTVSYFLYSADR